MGFDHFNLCGYALILAQREEQKNWARFRRKRLSNMKDSQNS